MTITLVVIAVLAAGLGALYLRVQRRQQAFFRDRVASIGLGEAPVEPWLAAAAERAFGVQGNAERMVRGERVWACDFTYQAMRSSTAAKCHVVAVSLPTALPPLAVFPKNPMLPGNLEFESAEFNRTFSVECFDRRYASAVLTPRVMEWLLTYPKLQWKVDGNVLLAWNAGYWTADVVRHSTAAFDGLLERIDPYVFEEFRAH
ncbi:hypothetical protein HPO96_28775 [Kribbella sandramycini]|uniref:Uncharacterized protein n=1 Tax=Kribbella sandramycini TaxID=60450 RepID=A0A7Y4L4M1_9ACTN|nr:hypothetical protein [Kribbella sandramycini]MBB6571603.1 hypothetical protein [Kribbella sandramycini]NOL44249.1 hypothetical protein [Kribbella sandramycini]